MAGWLGGRSSPEHETETAATTKLLLCFVFTITMCSHLCSFWPEHNVLTHVFTPPTPVFSQYLGARLSAAVRGPSERSPTLRAGAGPSPAARHPLVPELGHAVAGGTPPEAMARARASCQARKVRNRPPGQKPGLRPARPPTDQACSVGGTSAARYNGGCGG